MVGSRAFVPGAAVALLLLSACDVPPPSDPVGEAAQGRKSADASYPDNRPVYVANPPATTYVTTAPTTYVTTTPTYVAPAYVTTVPGPMVVGPSTVTIRFAGTVGDRQFRCGASYAGVGITGSTITPADFRMYVSNVALIDEHGRAVPMDLVEDGAWQSRTVALLDFEDGTGPCIGGTPMMRDAITGNIPPGRYRGLVFTLGIPADQNVGPMPIALPPLNVPAMAVAPTGGFRFLKVDMATLGQPVGAYPIAYPTVYGPAYVYPGAAGFPVHLAGTAVTISFPTFDFGRDVVLADLAGLLASTNVDANTPGTPAGCQTGPAADPDCNGVYSRLGVGTPPMQSFFRQASVPMVSTLTR